MTSTRTLSHFAAFRLNREHWLQPSGVRREHLEPWLGELRQAAPRVDVYQVYPTRGDVDLLLWSALPADDPAAPGEFFSAFSQATHKMRPYLEPGSTLWGLTRPSPYARRGSDRAIDAVEGNRLPYLVVYPFVKTADWYLKDREERQGMMNEHIRIGRQYDDVRQMLLYSFGLQDQEFVVVYEMEDLTRFSDLVRDLRETEARAYTERDTPLWTAIYRKPDEELALWV